MVQRTRREAPDLFAHFGIELEPRSPVEVGEQLASVVDGRPCARCSYLVRDDEQRCPVCGLGFPPACFRRPQASAAG